MKEIVLESEFDMLEHKVQDIKFILKMLDNAILSTNNYKLERANIFVPRIVNKIPNFIGELFVRKSS